MKKRYYGWKRGLPDHKDILFKVSAKEEVELPASIDLKSQCPPVLSQGFLGSCVSNAIANAHYFAQLKQRLANAFMPSRLFIYYNERVTEGTVEWDAGASVRDGILSVEKLGVCPETMWAYLPKKFTEKPTADCYKEAMLHQETSHQLLDNRIIRDLKYCLYTGFPFVFGFTIYESFEYKEVEETGIAKLPEMNEEILGGHAVMAVGYDDTTQSFTVMNSWGKDWGIDGYFTIPYDYLTNVDLAADFWSIRLVEKG